MADREPKASMVVPRGTREPISDEELDRLAEITPEDIQSAKAAWRRHAPADVRNLLDAEADDRERM